MNIEPALRDALLAATPNLRAFAVSLTGSFGEAIVAVHRSLVNGCPEGALPGFTDT
jgi:hypothetical protein